MKSCAHGNSSLPQPLSDLFAVHPRNAEGEHAGLQRRIFGPKELHIWASFQLETQTLYQPPLMGQNALCPQSAHKAQSLQETGNTRDIRGAPL